MADVRESTVVSLFDVDNTEDRPRVADMTIGGVTTKDVTEFANRYHYSRTGGGQCWRWGLWHGAVLYGLVVYNLPTRTLCESVFGAEHHDKVWHMSRLVLAETAPHNSESRLIAQSLKRIEVEYPHVWAVLTYAATDAGHVGTIYQATNAIYTGTGGDRHFYRDCDGNMRSTYGQVEGHSYKSGYISPTDALSRGWTVHDAGVKHRYVYLLGNKSERKQRRKLLRYPSLPYPKKDVSTDVKEG